MTGSLIVALLEIQLPARPVINEIQWLINRKIKKATTGLDFKPSAYTELSEPRIAPAVEHLH